MNINQMINLNLSVSGTSFWIGLEGLSSSLYWNDGTPYNQSTSLKPTMQNHGSSYYCIFSQAYDDFPGWNKIPFLCQGDLD